MRLERRVINKIKNAINDSFGNVDTYLFGSRVDDQKKGGDIDIAVDTSITGNEFRKKKIKFLANLFRQDFHLKIDIVNYNTQDTLLKQQINQNCIKL